MNKIERKGDWGSYEEMLDGVTLKDGEPIIVRWPDGDLQPIIVKIVSPSGTVRDMGNVCPTSQRTSYHVASHHSIEVLVPLVGLEAQRS
jgi:hypothetical protein